MSSQVVNGANEFVKNGMKNRGKEPKRLFISNLKAKWLDKLQKSPLKLFFVIRIT